jgi:hypothetical protein
MLSERDSFASLYWIRLENHSDVLTEGYVGVSRDVSQRMCEHRSSAKKGAHENIHLARAFSKYDVVVDVLYQGTVQDCLDREQKLRPARDIGWNIAVGGGNPPSTKGRKRAYQITEKQRQALSNNMKNMRARGLALTGAETTKGTSWWNNGKHQLMSKVCPEGYYPGRLSAWWTDGADNRFCKERPSATWVRGRTVTWKKGQ